MKDGESRDYIFNLRKGFLKSPSWRRSKKAIDVLRDLVLRHSKARGVRLGKWVSTELWKHGGKNPPSKVKVNVKVEKEIATAELAELPAKALRLAKLEEEKKKKAEAKKAAEKPEEKKEEKKEKPKKKTAKEERKTSKKELQKELAEAKEEEDKKKRAKVTAAQERALHK